VPIDRSRPDGRQLDLAFAVFPHTDPTSRANDAIFASDGGPGIANIANRGFQTFLLGDLTDKRDLVVVDHRGTGQSGAIDCPELQQVIGDLNVAPSARIRAIGKCGRQLGRDADRYGSGDVAMDLNAVRRALGYDKISMYGLSYAGAFLSAYATRFPERLRAVVIDAGVPTTDPRHSWTWGMDVPPRIAEVVELDCERAPACEAAQPRAESAVARIAAAVRRHPVSGRVDISGVGIRRVTVDEADVVALAWDLLNEGELAAVAQALDRGDKAPLLRLGGEARLAQFEPGDPVFDSAGDNAAAFCNDNDFVWKRSDPLEVRRAKYRHALAEMGPKAFAPFSRRAWTATYLTSYCLRWPAPDRFTPAVPRGATVTGVPVAILSGDLDTSVPTRTTRELLRVFPEATFVHAAGAAHPAAAWSDCARGVVHDFIRTLQAPTTACDDPAFVEAATSAFPELAWQAAEARSKHDDESTKLERKVVTVAVQTVRDAWLRSFRVPGAVGSVTGLRGGSGDFDYASRPDRALFQLNALSFASNVIVSGTTRFVYADNRITFKVTVDGPRGADGTLTAAGQMGFGAPFSTFIVTGNLNGHTIRVAVPAN
jgi:pimeloyl-ACP methyl ester carboxylesterase